MVPSIPNKTIPEFQVRCKDLSSDGFTSCIYKYTVVLVRDESDNHSTTTEFSVLLKVFSSQRITTLTKVYAGEGEFDDSKKRFSSNITLPTVESVTSTPCSRSMGHCQFPRSITPRIWT